MSRLEDRLIDALGAAAETVRPESAGVLREPTAPARTWRIAPLAAATAVAVIIILASVITPLALAGGHPLHSSTGTGSRSLRPSATRSGMAVAVPQVIGMSAQQAASLLVAAGLRVSITEQAGSGVLAGLVIMQTPAAGSRSAAGATVTLVIDSGPGPSPSAGPTQPPANRTITSTDLAVTITIPGTWQQTPAYDGATTYDGASGWVEIIGAAEPAALAARCTQVATSNVNHPFGLHPQIVYRSIDGRPGCLIYPSSDAPWEARRAGGPRFQTSAVLVEYAQPLAGGWGYLYLEADPQHLLAIANSIQLHH